MPLTRRLQKLGFSRKAIHSLTKRLLRHGIHARDVADVYIMDTTYKCIGCESDKWIVFATNFQDKYCVAFDYYQYITR